MRERMCPPYESRLAARRPWAGFGPRKLWGHGQSIRYSTFHEAIEKSVPWIHQLLSACRRHTERVSEQVALSPIGQILQHGGCH